MKFKNDAQRRAVFANMNKEEKMPKNKDGYIYIAESTRKNGSKKIYTGKTTKNPKTRVKQHIKEIKKPNSKTWVGRGKNIRLIGAVRSSNISKAEGTVKKMSPHQKRNLGQYGAKQFNKRKKRVK